MAPDRKISLFIVDDHPRILELMKKHIGDKYNLELFERGKDVIKAMEKREFDVGIIDLSMPDINGLELVKILKQQNTLTEFIILTGQADVSTAIESMKMGCYDYLTKPIYPDKLEVIIQKAYEKKLINKENIALKEEIQLKDKHHEIVGKSQKMKHVFTLIDKVSKTQSLVLITGESGTGKELAAKAIHKSSTRADKPFIIVDCTSLSENLLENELFGHEKGAFTDASNIKHGLLEVADQGTLFIDEIGEISLSLQSKLLRAIETQKFRRVGGNKEISVDIRIIAATNRDLKEEVKKDKFRKDLFYRLNVFPIHLPPLRERKEDIPLLVSHFLQTSEVAQRKDISKDAVDILVSYDWPGNIRELANVIERAIILSKETITKDDLPMEFSLKPAKEQLSASSQKYNFEPLEKKNMKEMLKAFEKNVILNTLNELKGNKTETAKALGLSRAKLYRKLASLGITNEPVLNK